MHWAGAQGQRVGALSEVEMPVPRQSLGLPQPARPLPCPGPAEARAARLDKPRRQAGVPGAQMPSHWPQGQAGRSEPPGKADAGRRAFPVLLFMPAPPAVFSLQLGRRGALGRRRGERTRGRASVSRHFRLTLGRIICKRGPAATRPDSAGQRSAPSARTQLRWG